MPNHPNPLLAGRKNTPLPYSSHRLADLGAVMSMCACGQEIIEVSAPIYGDPDRTRWMHASTESEYCRAAGEDVAEPEHPQVVTV